jgi:hypothetical protein
VTFFPASPLEAHHSGRAGETVGEDGFERNHLSPLRVQDEPAVLQLQHPDGVELGATPFSTFANP